MAFCTSNRSITARCRLDILLRPALPLDFDMAGSPASDAGEAKACVAAGGGELNTSVVAVRCDGIMIGVGRGGGGHYELISCNTITFRVYAYSTMRLVEM